MIRFIRATMATAPGRCFLSVIAVFALGSDLRAEPMVYTGSVVTDVRVGKTLLHNASLKITFEGETANIIPVVPTIQSQECLGTGYFFYLTQGVARMEIRYQGRTRTATLTPGQIFVALDTCSGGIGFGSFTGPNGLEPAYPLAFTLGTAEYAAVTAAADPLLSSLSVTGAAWSCIGFPPQGAGALPGTPSGNCLPPDSYPLKSDLGNIVIYQPYYEFDGPGEVSIASDHSGSTNRGSFLVRPAAPDPPSTEDDPESGVVYTLQTVADGSLGGHVFKQALVTFRMISNTHSVTSQPSSVDATKPVYENRAGSATVTVDDGGDVISAKFAPGEVYVRFDTGSGVAGFGSPISQTYPVALNCSDSGYPSDSSYAVDCLQGEVWNYLTAGDSPYFFRAGILSQLNDPVAPSPGVAALPRSLSQNTLLTGTAHTCAGVYTIGSAIPDAYFPGDLQVCGGPAPRGLHTSKGALFLQDLEGGTLSLGNAPIVVGGGESGTGGGWDLANSGFFHVEMFGDGD